MSQANYTYFIYFSFQCNNGEVTEITAVNDLPFKLDSKENIDKLYKRFLDELNHKLILQGLKAVNLIIKNFILISHEVKHNDN